MEPQQGRNSGPGSQPLQEEAAQAQDPSVAAPGKLPDARDSLQASCDEQQQRPPLAPVQGAAGVNNSLDGLPTPARRLLLSPAQPLRPGERWSPRTRQGEAGATLLTHGATLSTLSPQWSRAPVGPPGRSPIGAQTPAHAPPWFSTTYMSARRGACRHVQHQPRTMASCTGGKHAHSSVWRILQVGRRAAKLPGEPK